MDSKNGGQSSSDLQKQAAAALARKKVLAAYAESAKKAQKESNSSDGHLKSEPITPKIDSESWKKYHSAWQDYYQKYYSEYYSKAARAYIEKEKLKEAREKAEEEEILSSLTRSSAKLNKKSGLSLSEDSSESDDSATISSVLKSKIRKKAVESVKKTHRGRRLIPILAGLAVVLIILFLQYNRLVFAPIMAYVSPGNVPASDIEAIDPTITQAVSSDPRLIIPKLNVDVPVHFGISLSEVMPAMADGVAHYRIAGASAFPGEIGNLVITGHSAGDVYSSNPYKYIFSGLERLEDGDLIYINYKSTRYTYSVFKRDVVEPTNVAALVVDTDKPILTLVTCTPLGTSRYRLLLFAEQISPNYEKAGKEENLPTIDKNEETPLPSNEPSFFEGIWNFLTGN
ncbi:class E sortase [Candidatus Saccharibacteria bacterium]|nr:class E sortase [Candidatus Saccharibacteria bacterium]MBR3253175.1 class E sortase [Candidatus Saccharibacteria bacterium]